MSVKFTSEQQVTGQVKVVTDTGRPAKVDGPIKWTVVEGDGILGLVVNKQGTKATLYPLGGFGKATLRISADANLGEEVEEITQDIEVTVEAATAENAEVAFSDPVPFNGTPNTPEDDPEGEPTASRSARKS